MAEEITFKLRAISDFKDITSNIDVLRKKFQELKMPSDAYKGFDKTLVALETKITSAQEKLKNGFKTGSEINSFKRDLSDIKQLYAQIGTEIKGLNLGEVFKGIDSPELEDARRHLTDFENQLKQLLSTDVFKKLDADVKNLEGALGRTARKGVGELVDSLKKGDFDTAAQKVKELQQAIAKMSEGKTKDAYTNFLTQIGLNPSEIGTDLEKIKAQINQVFNGDQVRAAAAGIEEWQTKVHSLEISNIEDLENIIKQIVQELTQSSQGWSTMQRGYEETIDKSKQLNSELDQFKNRIAYFFGMNNAVRLFQRAIRSAYETVKDLDKVMTETAVVTDFTVSDMWAQLPEYTARANELGLAIHDVYEASTLYYQQGLKTNEVMAVTNATLRMARIAGLDAAEATDRVTNALRGFNMEITEANANNIADVYSKLAAMSASNVDEISTAMTKVASLANNANMEFETTAAFLAQIIETTRESAETAGTALKTVVARFSEVKKLYSEGELLGNDEEGQEIDVNKVSTALRTAGINLNEFLTGQRGLDEIFTELASKWDSLTIVQQRYIATMAAGSRQQSRFIALMSDYARTQELVTAAQNASGASQAQYEKTLDSLETKLNQLKNAWDEFVMGLAKDEAIKWVVDALTDMIGAINKLTANLPGLLKTVSRLGIAVGAFKGGGAIFNGLLRTIGTQLGTRMQDAGEKAAPLFAGGFRQSLNRLWPSMMTTLQPGIEKFGSQLSTAMGRALSPGEMAQVTQAFTTQSFEPIERMLGRIKGASQETIESLQNGFNSLIPTTELFANSVQRVSTAMTGIGIGLTLVAQLMRSLGLEKASKWIQGIGIALTGIGIILPQLIKLGNALGLTFDFIGIHAAKAGAEAAAGGSAATLAWSAFIPIALAIAAAVGLIIIAINNTPEKKIQKLQEHLEEVQEAAAEAKNQYNDLKSSIESIESAEATIEELDRGTREWRDAVLELNQQYLDLIDKIPALAPFLRSSGGVLSIDFNSNSVQGVIDSVQQDAIERSMQSTLAQQTVSNAQLSTARARTSSGGYQRPLSEREIEALDRAVLAMSGSAEQIAHYERQGIYNNGNMADYAAAIQQFESATNGVFLQIAGSNTYIERALDYGKLLLEEGAQLEAQNQALAASITTNANLDSSKVNFDDVAELLTSKALEAFQFEAQSEITGADRVAYNNYWTKWAASQGDINPTINANGSIKYTVEGETKTISAENALQQYNAHRLNTEGTAAIEQLVGRDLPIALHHALIQSSELVASDLVELTSNNINLDAIWADLSENEQKLFEGSQEVFENWIAHNTQALRDALTQSVKYGFNNFDKLDISAGAIQSINSMFEQYQAEYGANFASNFVDQINNITSDESLDTDAFLSFIGSVSDWSKKTVPDVLKEMSQLDIEFGDSEDAIKALIAQFIDLDQASAKINLEDFKTLLSNSAELLNELSGRSATDRTFTQDQYEKLLAISPDLVSDMVWNGTDWSYIGGSLNSLEEAIRANTDAILSERIEALNGEIKIGEGFAAVDSDRLQRAYNYNTGTEDALADANMDILRKDILDSVGLDRSEYATLMGEALESYFIEQVDKYFGTNGSVLAENITTRDNYETSQKVAEILNSGQTMTSIQGQANIGIANGENNAYAQAILAQAAAYGVAEQELEDYNALLDENGNIAETDKKKAQDLLNTIAKSAALAKAAKDMENYGKAISDNLKTLEEYDEGSREYNDALKAMTEQTERFFGGLELPDNFFNAENLQLLQDALNGSDQAWVDYIENVNAAQAAEGAWADAAIFDTQEVKAVADAVDGTEIHIDGTADVNSIIESMFNAGASAQEVADFLNELGYAHVDFKASNFKSLQEIQEWMNNNPGQTLNGSILGSIEATNVRVPNRGSFSGGAGGGGGSGGGGGGGGSKKSWKNPYDELYNLTEKINEALRQRNILEEDYDRLLQRHDQDSTSLYKNSLRQIDSLNKEIQLQKQLRAGRLSQLSNVGSEKIETEDGFKTYAEMGVVKYANYNPDTGLLQIDWEGINQIEDTEVGKAVEEYVKRLEELQGQIEDTDKTIREMEDNVYEIRQRGKQDAVDMENRIAEALQNQQQKVIDEYQALADTISNSNEKVLNSLQESIDLSRQIRDNTKTEEDIAEKEARLAYLRRDTSGANMLEIQQLEQELEDARQSYTDTLIDQSIDRLSNDNQKAADQRAQQIEIMQSQLDYAVQVGEFVAQAHTMVLEAVQSGTWNTIKDLLMEDEGFKYLSEFAQQLWLQDLDTAIGKTTEGVNNFLNPTNGTIDQDLKNIETAINNGFSSASSGSGGNDTSGSRSPGGTPETPPRSPATLTNNNPGAYSVNSNYRGVEQAQAETRAADFAEARRLYNSTSNTSIQQQILATQIEALNKKWGLNLSKTNPASLNAYKSGGLADFTGPAWLDGSKSRPELVLNARDTENFIALRNILAHLLNGQAGGANTNTSGEINLDIDINVDQIANDYDVDRLVERVKSNIYQDASYRNINQINFIR